MSYEKTPAISNTDGNLYAYMKKMFQFVTGAMALATFSSFFTATNPELLALTGGSMSFVFLIVWFAMAFFGSKIISSASPGTALFILMGFAAFTGFALTPVILQYTGETITAGLVIATGMFAGAGFFGYFTNKSLSGWTHFLNLACWGLIAAIIAHLLIWLFTGSALGWLDILISLIAVPLFALLTAWEVNMHKEQYESFANEGEEVKTSMALVGASSLFMNWVIMVLHTLNLIDSD